MDSKNLENLKTCEINPRQEKLLNILSLERYKSIADLAVELNVSEQTIRRDITKLDSSGLLSKYHGGAIISRTSKINNSTNDSSVNYNNKNLQEREISFVKEKEIIAKSVCDLIKDGSSIFITIGTTVEFIARELLNQKKDLTVITDSLRVASILFADENINLIIPSGSICHFNGGIEGPNTLRDLSQFRVDFLVTSVGAVDTDGTLLDYNYAEVALVQQMMKNAKKVIIACDSSKEASIAPIKLCDMSEIDFYITDKKPMSDLLDKLKENDVKLIVSSM